VPRNVSALPVRQEAMMADELHAKKLTSKINEIVKAADCDGRRSDGNSAEVRSVNA
jgi:hypothetical protein